jgi:signal transduction histidine kinase
VDRDRADLESIAHAAAETVAPLAQDKHIDFAIDLLPSAGTVMGDPARLQQTVEHLLRHAISGSNGGGRVLLHLDGTEKAARIVVSDDGAGMSPDQVARCFDRFAQPGFTQPGDRALGLGLPLAKQFVEAHGGTITLLSEPGEGTLITVMLPRG